jgi:hypothetical protein
LQPRPRRRKASAGGARLFVFSKRNEFDTRLTRREMDSLLAASATMRHALRAARCSQAGHSPLSTGFRWREPQPRVRSTAIACASPCLSLETRQFLSYCDFQNGAPALPVPSSHLDPYRFRQSEAVLKPGLDDLSTSGVRYISPQRRAVLPLDHH